MSKIFVIPDIHLKPWMFDKAKNLILEDKYDAVVLLGDLVDDWGQERNIKLYNDTFDAAIDFVKSHPDTFWCYGNHDVSYIWQAMETGYSHFAEVTVIERLNELKKALPPENTAFIHRFDNTLFSHAGLVESFVLHRFANDTDIDYIISKINRMGEKDLWRDNSPIWARPQIEIMRLYPMGYLQVVGHTPVKEVIYEENLLTLDNFSTHQDGRPIGNEKFVWVDTTEKKWEYVE